jgi:hypothetical protein
VRVCVLRPCAPRSLTGLDLSYTLGGGGESRSLRLETIGGASVDSSNQLIVHSFPLETGLCCCSSPARKQQNTGFGPCASAAEAAEWKLALLQALAGVPVDPSRPLPRRHLLVLVNPFSGVRAGRANLGAVRHILTMRGASLEEVETTHAGHAQDLVGNFEPLNYDGIVIFSGDPRVWGGRAACLPACLPACLCAQARWWLWLRSYGALCRATLAHGR